MAAHRHRVAQDKTQQLAAHEHHAALEHDRISHFSETEHVAARHCHLPKSILELLNWVKQRMWLSTIAILPKSIQELFNWVMQSMLLSRNAMLLMGMINMLNWVKQHVWLPITAMLHKSMIESQFDEAEHVAASEHHAPFEYNMISQLNKIDHAASCERNAFGHRYRATQVRLDKGNSRLAFIFSIDILAGLNDAPESRLGNRAPCQFCHAQFGHMKIHGLQCVATRAIFVLSCEKSQHQVHHIVKS